MSQEDTDPLPCQILWKRDNSNQQGGQDTSTSESSKTSKLKSIAVRSPTSKSTVIRVPAAKSKLRQGIKTERLFSIPQIREVSPVPPGKSKPLWKSILPDCILRAFDAKTPPSRSGQQTEQSGVHAILTSHYSPVSMDTRNRSWRSFKGRSSLRLNRNSSLMRVNAYPSESEDTGIHATAWDKPPYQPAYTYIS